MKFLKIAAIASLVLSVQIGHAARTSGNGEESATCTKGAGASRFDNTASASRRAAAVLNQRSTPAPRATNTTRTTNNG